MNIRLPKSIFMESSRVYRKITSHACTIISKKGQQLFVTQRSNYSKVVFLTEFSSDITVKYYAGDKNLTYR